jgi:hypothetical protein
MRPHSARFLAALKPDSATLPVLALWVGSSQKLAASSPRRQDGVQISLTKNEYRVLALQAECIQHGTRQEPSFLRLPHPNLCPTDVQVVSELLKPFSAEHMRCYPVNARVNHVANGSEECSRPVDIAEDQNRLFV